MIVKAWVATLAASVVTLGLTGCDAPNANDPPASGTAANSAQSKQLIRPVQHTTNCTWAAVERGWEKIYAVCVVPSSRTRPATAYIYNVSDDHVLYMTAKTGPQPQVGGTQNISPDTSDELVTHIAGEMLTARPGPIGILVPPHGYATTTEITDISIDDYRTTIITVIRAAAKVAEDRLTPDSLASQIRDCAKGSKESWGVVWDEINRLNNYASAPPATFAIVDPLIYMTSCKVFSDILKDPKPHHQRPVPPKLGNTPQVAEFLETNTDMASRLNSVKSLVGKFVYWTPR